MKNSTAKAIESVMKKLPLLTSNGIMNPGIEGSKQNEEFNWRRQSLSEDTNSFEKVCQWLNDQGISKIKTMNRNHTSYGYKHMVEENLGGYISNGIFIAAAIHCGFDYKITPGSLNVEFNISEKSISKLKRIK